MRKLILSFLLASLLLPSISIKAQSIVHVEKGNQIYSITASNNSETPFNVYINGEEVGQYGIEDVLRVGFTEDDLVEVLKLDEDEISSLKKQTDSNKTVKQDNNEQIDTSKDPAIGAHPDLMVPSQTPVSEIKKDKVYYDDILYPSSEFSNVGGLSTHESYSNQHEFEMMLSDYAHIARDNGIFPSVMIGQAMLESGESGSSGLAKTNKNIFGIKGEYNGNGTMWDTLEDYGGMVQVNDQFRLYPTYKESVMDYVRLLTETDRYSQVVRQTTPEAQITAIKEGGYATDSNYITKVINLINQYNLTKYDF